MVLANPAHGHEIDFLRRRVRELEEELAEYRRREAPDEDGEAERLDFADRSWRRPLWARMGRHAVHKGSVRLLMIMLDRPGHIYPTAYLLDRLLVNSTGPSPHLVKVYVHHARLLLSKHGVAEGLDTIWGTGFRLTHEAAARLQRLWAERAAADVAEQAQSVERA